MENIEFYNKLKKGVMEIGNKTYKCEQCEETIGNNEQNNIEDSVFFKDRMFCSKDCYEEFQLECYHDVEAVNMIELEYDNEVTWECNFCGKIEVTLEEKD